MIFIVVYNRQILELNYEVQVKILRIWSHLLKKSLMESFIFSAVYIITFLKNYRLFFPYFV